MSIFQPGDFPINPDIVDGTELADRLNRAAVAIDNAIPDSTKPLTVNDITVTGKTTLKPSFNGILEATNGEVGVAAKIQGLPIDNCPIGGTTPEKATFSDLAVNGKTTLATSLNGALRAENGEVKAFPFPVLVADGVKKFELRITKAGNAIAYDWEEDTTLPHIPGTATDGFAKGTRMLFAQATAPVGWTQILDDTTTNRLIRVTNLAGGGVGGTVDPTAIDAVSKHTHNILIDGVKDHSHSLSLGASGGAHTHSTSLNLSNTNIDHTHGGTTGSQNSNHTHGASGGGHVHDYNTKAWMAQQGTGLSGARMGDANAQTGGGDHGHNMGGVDRDHQHSFTTGGGGGQHTHGGSVPISGGDHSHTGTVGDGGNHTHTGTIAEAGANWAPRYVDIIICERN